jgi:hypothetical protein
MTALFIGVYADILSGMFHRMFQGVSSLTQGMT